MSAHVINAIAGPLFLYTESPQGEQNVRAYLIEPMIRELTKHSSKLTCPPPPPAQGFTTTVNMEYAIKLCGGSGHPPMVDFVIIVRASNVLNIIPGEAKVDMQTQINLYHTT